MTYPALRLRVLPRLPVRVIPSDGIEATISGGTLNIGQDWRVFSEASPPNLAGRSVLVQDDTTGVFERIAADRPVDAVAWGSVTGKPSTFPPDVHGHTAGQISGLTDAIALQADEANAVNSRLATLAFEEERRGLLSPQGRQFVSALAGTQSIPNITYTAIVFASANDTIFGWRSATSTSRLYVPNGTRFIELRGAVNFAPGGTGTRIVAIYKNGVFFRNFGSAPAGLAAVTVFCSTTDTTADGDYYDIRVFQDSGGALNVDNANITLEILHRDTQRTPLRGNRIYQGLWPSAETLVGGRTALINRLAEFGVLALSHIGTIGFPSNPWLGTPPLITTGPNTGNLIVDSGWADLPDVIRAVKAKNPAIQIFGYISPAIDNPSWDSAGNNTSPTTTAMGYTNTLQWADLWFSDKTLPISGLFLDHFVSPFMTTARRDEVVALLKARYGCQLMVNITSPAVANVQYAGECTGLTHGDRIALEGFYRDNGTDVEAATNLIIPELAKLKLRGIKFDAIIEAADSGIGADAYNMNNGDLAALNGKALWDLYDWPGDTIDYNRPNYAAIQGPLA